MKLLRPSDARQRAIDETRNDRGEPLVAIAFAIIYLADVLDAQKR